MSDLGIGPRRDLQTPVHREGRWSDGAYTVDRVVEDGDWFPPETQRFPKSRPERGGGRTCRGPWGGLRRGRDGKWRYRFTTEAARARKLVLPVQKLGSYRQNRLQRRGRHFQDLRRISREAREGAGDKGPDVLLFGRDMGGTSQDIGFGAADAAGLPLGAGGDIDETGRFAALDVLVVRGRGRRDPRRPELSHCVYALRSQSVAMSEVSFVCRSDRRLAVESQYESLTS